MGFYINLFKDMVSFGILDTGNQLHVHALRFAFWDLIEADLQRTAIEWNRHRLQVKKNYECVKGIPDMLYFNPEAYSTRDYGFFCDPETVDPVLCDLEENGSIPPAHDPDFVQLVKCVLPSWSLPMNSVQAVRLFGEIVKAITNSSLHKAEPRISILDHF